MSHQERIAVGEIEATGEPAEERRADCAKRPDNEYNPDRLLPSRIRTPQSEQLDAERANQHSDGKMDGERMKAAEPTHETLPKRLLFIGCGQVRVRRSSVPGSHSFVTERRVHRILGRSVCLGDSPRPGAELIVVLVRDRYRSVEQAEHQQQRKQLACHVVSPIDTPITRRSAPALASQAFPPKPREISNRS